MAIDKSHHYMANGSYLVQLGKRSKGVELRAGQTAWRVTQNSGKSGGKLILHSEDDRKVLFENLHNFALDIPKGVEVYGLKLVDPYKHAGNQYKLSIAANENAIIRGLSLGPGASSISVGKDVENCSILNCTLTRAVLRLQRAGVGAPNASSCVFTECDVRISSSLSDSNIQTCAIRLLDGRICGADIRSCYDYFSASYVGTEEGTLYAYYTKEGKIHVKRGCFEGTVREFRAALRVSHYDKFWARNYMKLISVAEASIKQSVAERADR